MNSSNSDHNKTTMTSTMTNASVEHTIIPVADAINDGIRLAQEKRRRISVTPTVKPLFKASTGCDCIVHQIQYPEPEVFQGCQHAKAENRNVINRKQHLKILAAPNPTRLKISVRPTVVQKRIHCATYRLATIAQPRKSHVQCTWALFADVLDAYHIDNCRKHLQQLRFPHIKEALQYFAQTQRYEATRRKERRHSIRAIGKEIRKLNRQKRMQRLQCVLDDIYGRMRTFLLADNVHLLDHRAMQVSAVVLRALCTFVGYSLPTRKSSAYFDRFLVNVADNVAIWLNSFVLNCGGAEAELKTEFDDADRRQIADDNGMIPIDDYVECSTDDVSSVDGSHSQVSLKSTADVEADEDDDLLESITKEERNEFSFYS